EVLHGLLFLEDNLDPNTLRLAALGTARWNAPDASFAPRFGVALQLADERGRETVLRGGAGVYYDLGTGLAGRLDSPVTVRGPTRFPSPLPTGTNPNLTAAPEPIPPYGNLSFPARAFASDLQLPRTTQISLTLEQALGVDQSLSASYVGAFGRK